jgi:serine/threonine-protein kinase
MHSIGTLAKGQVVDQTYEVVFFIGEGAFGEVYRVKHRHLGVQVLKLLKQDFDQTADLDEISREARLLAKITHPNVVRVFEANSFTLDGRTRHYLTMGFVSGETLTQLLARRITLTRDDAVSLMSNVLQGLSYVHSMRPPLIHRDINLDNILISYEGPKAVALLSDFGLAQTLDALDHLPGAGGRYPYMASECFWGTYLLSSDVFSAGVVLYRLLTGLHPWQYDFEAVCEPTDIVTEIARARKAPPYPPSFRTGEEDQLLDRIVLKAINRVVETRYPNGGEFLAALEYWLGERPAT